MTWERYTTRHEDNITHLPLRAQALETSEEAGSLGRTVEDRVAIHPKDSRQGDTEGEDTSWKEGKTCLKTDQGGSRDAEVERNVKKSTKDRNGRNTVSVVKKTHKKMPDSKTKVEQQDIEMLRAGGRLKAVS